MAKSIVPEFMKKDPEDTFVFLFPLRLKIDDEQIKNSHFEVVVKNLTKNEVFTEEMSPEIFFTHYPLLYSYKNGKINKDINTEFFEKKITIDTASIDNNSKIKLKDVLSEKNIVSILGWRRKYLYKAMHNYCYVIKQGDIDIIIPQYAVAIYFYYRFTLLREAVLQCKADIMHKGCICQRDDAKIVLNRAMNDVDAAFIHRYICSDVAQNGFEDVAQYIHNCRNDVKKNNQKKYKKPADINTVPIKAKIPVKEIVTFDLRVALLENEDTGKKYYYVHEIVNDDSDIGFDKFTKILEEEMAKPDIVDLGDLPRVKTETPRDTSDVLTTEHAGKRYKQSANIRVKRKSNSLKNVSINEEKYEIEVITGILNIHEETESDGSFDQSTTEAASGNKKKVRKVVVSSEFEKEIAPPSEIENLIVFKKYIGHLKTHKSIKNISQSDTLKLPHLQKEGTDRVNRKCKIKKANRHYITVTFQYNNQYAGLLELENKPNESTGTWVLISDRPIQKSDFERFLELYLKKDLTVTQLKNSYKNTNPSFQTKNHEREENLSEEQLYRWCVRLIAKFSG